MINTPAELKARYPYQFAGPIIYMSFARGWFQTFAQLCDDIDVTLGENKHGFHWIQLKEKFGVVRAYYQLEPGFSDREPVLREKLMELKNTAEARTSRICASCGDPGKVDPKTGWLIALCPMHRAQQLDGKLESIWLKDHEAGS